jgi:hypothetical protein
LTLTAHSSNPALIPDANILFGGGGSNRTVTLVPLTNQLGAATITIIVTDTFGETNSDSFVLTVAPLVLDPTIITRVMRTNGTTQVSFSTQLGRIYAVEFKDELTNAVWSALGPVAGTGSELTVEDGTASSPRRFYRVRVQ